MGRFWGKLENVSLFLWLLLIPTQLGKFFWPEWSMVRGIRSDYLAPVVYLLDIVWIIWMGSGLINFKLKHQNLKKVVSFENLLIIVFIGLNILVAGNKWVAAYKWLRIGQWVITLNKLKNQKSKVKTMLVWIIPFWITMETLLGVGQMVKGGSLEGVWYWLGERRFSLTTIGIAQISWLGNGLVRAYGTFSHPNSLAGFLLVAWMLWQSWQKKRGVMYWVIAWCSVLGIVIAGSRMVWALLVMQLIITNYELRIKKKRLGVKNLVGYLVIITGVLMLILGVVGVNYRISDFVGGWDTGSLTKRVMLGMMSVEMWRDNLMLGVGAGNFIADLPVYQEASSFYWLQPVHNIFLLVGAELGILGIMLVIYKILDIRFQIMRRRNWLILGIIIVTGMVDHYWLTLPQNYWLLVVVFAVL